MHTSLLQIQNYLILPVDKLAPRYYYVEEGTVQQRPCQYYQCGSLGSDCVPKLIPLEQPDKWSHLQTTNVTMQKK